MSFFQIFSKFVGLTILLFGLITPIIADTKFSKHKSTAERIQSHGYPAEVHYIETQDKYILGAFHIPYSHRLQNQNEHRPVVLLFHGLFSCSDAFILTGPESALAYNLVDSGYDVWLGNARGNYYSRNNSYYSTLHPYFWRFSWHEIGYYDVTALIDYALSISGEKSLHYIGHSQGTTSFIVAMSTRPDYNEKIKTAHLMAPVAYMGHVTDPMLKRLSESLGHQGVISNLFGTQEFLPHNSLFMQLGYTMCGEQNIGLGLCSPVAVILEGYSPNANASIFPILAETHPAGASTDQVVHYMQSISTGLFRRFDYGVRQNMLLYKQDDPPRYELSAITAAVYLYYGDNDGLAVGDDVLQLASELPNVIKLHRVPDPTWAHADFTWAVTAKAEINGPIIETLNTYEYNH